jgi:hypothetical protein
MLDRLKAFASARPRLAAWIALAIGMVIILIIAARDVGLQWNQWLFLILATIGLAGLCVWIIGWESGDDEDADAAADAAAGAPAPSQPSANATAETSTPAATDRG